jgi:hypothetical protein
MKYLFLVLLIVACSKPEKPTVSKVIPKYKVGDCVSRTFEYISNDNGEFLPPKTEIITLVNKIIKIGKNNYLVDIGAGLFREKEIESVDSRYELVDCSKMDQ